MANIGRAAAAVALLALGAQAVAQAPAAQQQAASNEQMDLFKKGFAACLEPKGYTVK